MQEFEVSSKYSVKMLVKMIFTTIMNLLLFQYIIYLF